MNAVWEAWLARREQVAQQEQAAKPEQVEQQGRAAQQVTQVLPALPVALTRVAAVVLRVRGAEVAVAVLRVWRAAAAGPV